MQKDLSNKTIEAEDSNACLPRDRALRVKNLFGTDGVRGRADSEVFSKEALFRLGRSIARQWRQQEGFVSKRGVASEGDGKLLIGLDSRVSGPAIMKALQRGLAHEGILSYSAGIVPTPVVSLLVAQQDFDRGIVVSASHNPPEFNGIKVFDSQGQKLTEEAELEISANYQLFTEEIADLEPVDMESSSSARALVLGEEDRFLAQYLSSLHNSMGGEKYLSGMKIVLDCACGATVATARAAFETAGAEVSCIFEKFDGEKINVDCGSTAPELVGKEVLKEGAHLGIAFDGDGDRAILVDEKGKIVDGDEVMALWGLLLKEEGLLKDNKLVATVMSNAGMEAYLLENGIELLRAPVGDRAVYSIMKAGGYALGGEQSGHIIYLPQAVSGDGVRTGLHMARLILKSGKGLSELREEIPRFPQTLLGVEVDEKPAFEQLPLVVEACKEVQNRLGGKGRYLLRYSGTEPLARVLIEGPDPKENVELANIIADAIRKSI